MFIHITVINLFDHNVGMVLDSDVHITGINLFDHNVGMACAKVRLQMFIHITGINLFDHNVRMVRCTKVRFRCSFISLVLIYLITMWVWHT